jgi:hypothetical protein
MEVKYYELPNLTDAERLVARLKEFEEWEAVHPLLWKEREGLERVVSAYVLFGLPAAKEAAEAHGFGFREDRQMCLQRTCNLLVGVFVTLSDGREVDLMYMK